MNKPQLRAKLSKERALASSRSEYLENKQDACAEADHNGSGGVGNTVFRAVLEPVGNGGGRIFVPKIARLNANAEPGCAVEVTIRRVDA